MHLHIYNIKNIDYRNASRFYDIIILIIDSVKKKITSRSLLIEKLMVNIRSRLYSGYPTRRAKTLIDLLTLRINSIPKIVISELFMTEDIYFTLK